VSFGNDEHFIINIYGGKKSHANQTIGPYNARNADLRDIFFDSGRRKAGWGAINLRAGQRMQPSLCLVRYALQQLASRR